MILVCRAQRHCAGIIGDVYRGVIEGDTRDVEIVETFSDLAQLVFVFLVVECGPHRFNRLIALSLTLLRHKKSLTWSLLLYVV